DGARRAGPGRAALQGRRHPRRDRVEQAVPRQPRRHDHRHPDAAGRGHQAGAEDLRGRAPEAGLGGRRARRVRGPPGQQGAHRGLHQGHGHRPEEGPDHLRRARQHRPGLGADRAEQAARDGPAEEGQPHRAAGHRLGPELLDGRGGLVAAVFPGYPFEPRRIEVRPGIAMSCLDEGPRDGEVVLMLHGNPSWSYYWRHLVLGLRDPASGKAYRGSVPDQVGMGLGDKPDVGGGVRLRAVPASVRCDYTLQARVDDLGTLLGALGVTGSVTLAVHDWGGMVGFGWALSRMQRVQRLVVLNTAAFPLPAAKPMPWQLSLGRDSRIGGWLIRRFNLFARGAAWLGTERRLPAAVREAYIAPYRGWDAAISTLRFMQDIPLREGDRAWALVAESGRRLHEYGDRPAFIGWGLRDFVFDRHFLEGFRRALPRAEVHAFEDAGHYVLEDRHEVLVPAIR